MFFFNTLSTTKNYADGSILTQSHLDTAFSSIETTVNGLLDSETNIDFDNIIRFDLNGNDYLEFNDTNDTLDLYVDGTASFRFTEAAASMTLHTLVSNANFLINTNRGGTDTLALTIAGSTGNVTVAATLIATSPQITTGIKDANGNEIIDIGATTSAINQVKVSNAAASGKPKIEALGDDTNVSLDLDAKGTGIIQLLQAGVSQVVALTDGANIATDASLGNIYTVTLGGNRTLNNPTAATAGQTILYRITQDGTGSRTLSYGTNFRFSTDLASPTLSTAANKVDYLGFTYNSAETKWDVVFISKGY